MLGEVFGTRVMLLGMVVDGTLAMVLKSML
jgi:hypothetical protein